MDNIITLPGTIDLHKHHRLALAHPISTAEEVKEVRRKRGESQKDFARLIGVSLSTLRRWERRFPQGFHSPCASSASVLLRWIELESDEKQNAGA
jgi:DNA-binding transcriptional regulator YiaG